MIDFQIQTFSPSIEKNEEALNNSASHKWALGSWNVAPQADTLPLPDSLWLDPIPLSPSLSHQPQSIDFGLSPCPSDSDEDSDDCGLYIPPALRRNRCVGPPHRPYSV